MYYLAMYFGNRCHDWFLPEQDAWSIHLIMRQRVTSLDHDLVFSVRALEGQIYLTPAPGFVWSEGKGRSERVMTDGTTLRMTGPLNITCVVWRVDRRGTAMRKYMFPERAAVRVGSDDANQICQKVGLMSGQQGDFLRQGQECVFTDRSRNGSFCNGIRVNGSQKLAVGDVVTMGAGLKVCWLGSVLAVNSPTRVKHIQLTPAEPFRPVAAERKDDAASSVKEYHLAPRIVQQPNTDIIKLEPPPGKREDDSVPMWLSVGPSSTMIVPMLLSTMVRMGDGSRFNPWPMLVMIGGSASLAVFWGIMNRNWRQKHTTEVEAKRQTIYRQYVARTEEELMSLVDQENARLNEQALSVTRCMELPSSSTHRLWERIATHPDFSTVRLGTGQVNMPITIELPDMRLSLVDDPLTEEPARLHQTYSQMSNAPITLRLRDYPMVGVLGSRRHPSLLQSMVLQLAATHSYHDLRIAVLTGEQNMSQWEWARWLPHAWATEDRDLRMVVWTPGAVDEVLSYLDGVLSVRAERVKDQAQSAEDAAEAPQPLPHFVVICTDPRILDNQPLVRKVIEQPLGMTLVLQASSTDRLPKECSLIIQGSDQQGAVYNDRGDVTGVVFEWPQLKDLKRFAYELAPIRVSDNTESTAIPSLVTFMDIYHARDTRDIDVWRFWNENHAWEGLRSTIGLRSGSQPFVLDISDKPQSHGPHGLVAGTTGSGKSVMLQTYILSLALNYHPNQVQFILIDYKGGGTANAFAGLPHVAGVIDNLQGQRSIQRALQSIQGEIKRREEAFKRLGIDHIDDYIRYYNDDPAEQPLAHLIVVVDEFAELKKEQPDFMRELVSAARVGRSVGMHLILATQKPSNSVDDEIWSNTRFRICLRVASRADSNDMLKRPDAAYLKGMGRCYVQVGNDEIFEQVQTSYSGAEYAPTALTAEELPKLLNDAGQPIRVRKKKSKQQSEQPAETQMDAVMKRIIEVARQHSVPNAHRLWLEELEAVQLLEKLLPGTFDGQHWPRADEDIVAAVGMLDDTRQQQHRPWTLNISARRNLMIVGPAASGKTTLLQTIALSLALRYSPDRVNLYIFSLTSNTLEGLRGLPHVGDVVLKNDPNEAVRLLQLIMREDQRRRKLFEAMMTDSFAQYNRAAASSGKETLPAVVVMVDRLAQLYDCLNEDMSLRLNKLLGECASRGIYFIVTCMSLNREEMPPRVRELFSGVALRLGDREAFREALGLTGFIPAETADISAFPGRGLAVWEGGLFETQAAVYAAAADQERAQAVRALAARMDKAWQGRRPEGILRIPEDFTVEKLVHLPGCHIDAFPAGNVLLGVNKERGLPVVKDFNASCSLLIGGPMRSGKTTALLSVCDILRRRGAEVHLFGTAGRLAEWAQLYPESVTLLTGQEKETVTYFNDVLVPEAQRRHKLRKAIPTRDTEALAAFEAEQKPVVIAIDDLKTFQRDNKIGADVSQKICAFLAQACAYTSGTGVYYLFTVATGDVATLAVAEPAKTLRTLNSGILMGGNLMENAIWSAAASTETKRLRLPLGEGLYLGENGYEQISLAKV